ncbi:MAG: hydrogenase 4 subunit B [Methylohalobius sp.]|nr:hydrogenase 4 subunit B [Methylohalobius sp.]
MTPRFSLGFLQDSKLLLEAWLGAGLGRLRQRSRFIAATLGWIGLLLLALLLLGRQVALPFCLLSVALALTSGLTGLWADKYPQLVAQVCFPLLLWSGIAGLTGGLIAATGQFSQEITLPFGLPWLSWHLTLDALSGFFFIVVSAVLLAVALFGPQYVREYESGPYSPGLLALATGLFVAGMQSVLLAADAFFFMIAWELMSVASYFLVAYTHEKAENRQASFLYLLMAEVGALFIILAFGVLVGFGEGFTFAKMKATELSLAWAAVAFTLGLIGFGMKAGLVPLHAWLPEAHPVAPSHISALMSGVMLKVAVYGFIRFSFDLLGELHWGEGLAVLVAGSFSAVFGILLAFQQTNLKRLLAYSSVENIGIIFTGLGLSILFYSEHKETLGAIGLIAALYHTLNHALFKSLLFLGAGAILQRSHESNLERMGGLISRMPVTAVLFLIGCLSISALPPFNGFVSEWLTYQAALQVSVLDSGVLRSFVPMTAALLALTGGLAAACFAKVFGVAFLGVPRSHHVQRVRRLEPLSVLVGMSWLAGLCLVLGILPASMLRLLEGVAISLTGVGLPSSASHGWLWLVPVAPETASYAALWVFLALGLAWILAFRLLYRNGNRAERLAYPWDCGFGNLTPRMQYSATAFAMPIRRIFAGAFVVREEVEEPALDPGRGLRYRLHVDDRLWGMFYEPVAYALRFGVRYVGRIQMGNIRVYLGYSFFTLIFLLWVTS